MRYGVHYRLKHSGSFFYKFTNENEDGEYDLSGKYKLKRVPLPVDKLV